MESNIKLFLKKLFRKYNAIKISTKLFYKCYDYILLQFLHWLNQKHLNLIETKLGIHTVDNPTKYESLIPSEDADKDNKYSEALKVALQIPKVNNIAITGPYGSGKSSFLRTFERNNSEWVYLPISLATFKDEQNASGEEEKQNIVFSFRKKPEQKSKEDTQYERNQQIEKSILQQIFYREKESQIPHSRFKRIKNIKRYWIAFHVIFLAALGVLGSYLYAPKYFKTLFLITELPQLNEKVLLSFFFLGSIYFLYQFLKYLMNLQVSKLNLKDGEIELGNKEKTSILNEHLDEILYFFEVTSYNVVVLEDLDRFDNTEIFIKLRELNTLINNSKEIGRRVVFIYAIKDEMFKDKDRTKFFDFILPIIPYINPSNSLEKIKTKFKKETSLDQDFLSDIALYIDDMRLLVNIYNEYMVYKHKLTGDNLDKNKLLAMIIYKNLYPSDFAKLHFNNGVVSLLINNKVQQIQKQIDKKLLLIDEIEIKINNIKNETIENISELKMIYLCKLAEKLNATHFKIDNKDIYHTLEDLQNDSLFDSLRTCRTISGHIYYSGYRQTQSSRFQEIETMINDEYSYVERKQFIEDKSNNQIEILRENIEKIKYEIDIIKTYTMQKLIQNTDEDVFGNDFVDKDILKFFIRNGFIDENYHDYISYFFEGSITLNDREFLLSVKNNKPLEFTYRLNKIGELLKRLKDRDFGVSAILNFDLLMYLLRNEVLPNNLLEKFFEKLSDESEESIRFTFEFIGHIDSSYSVKFVPMLWKKFWWYVIKKSEFSQKKIDELFDLLLKYANVEKLIDLNVENTLKEYIEGLDYLNGYDIRFNEKYENLFDRLNIKFQAIKIINNIPLFTYIYENNHYQINIDMLNKIAFVKGAPESEIEDKLKVAHFTTLNELVAIKKMMSYIDANINEYIENVFLKIETNTQESEKSLLTLLNHANVLFENKIAIIQKEERKISDITNVINETWANLFKSNKIVANWSNLLHYYIEVNELDDVILSFLNEKENYTELAKSSIAKEEKFDKTILQQFSKKIVVAKNINDDAYTYLVKSTFWRWPNVEIEGMSDKRINIILENKKLSLSQVNINNIKEYFPNKLIILVEDFKAEFLEKIADFTLESSDYNQILKSSKFTNDEKILIIEKIDLALFDDEKLVESTIEVFANNPKKLPTELFDKLFEKSTHDFALMLLTVQVPYLDNDAIIQCLKEFSSPYSDLAEIGANELKFDNNQLNSNLLNALKTKKIISNVKPDATVIKAIRFRKEKKKGKK